MCSKVLNGHIILTDTSITTILAPEMTYTPNFTSWRSFTDGMLDDIIACETPEEYQAVFETCAGYLKMDNDRLMPVITSVGYASIADINGVFYVGDVKRGIRNYREDRCKNKGC